MIRSAVTVSLVEQAKRGPFVFHDNLEAACSAAAQLGFDGIEIFAPSPQVVQSLPLQKLLNTHGLKLASLGTGAGMLVHRLQLCDPDPAQRKKAEEFIADMLRAGADFGAPAIVGSMQGRWDEATPRPVALQLLSDAMERLGRLAESLGTVLLYEPLNRYETNLCNTMREGVQLLAPLSTRSVKILADLFHLNIEETSVGDGLRDTGAFLGHVHFVDSNRQAAGRGHIDFGQVANVLGELNYCGYASAEAFPIPDSLTAAEQTIRTFRKTFGKA
jgi:sugar phosphate isomerase/epimerase